MRLPFTAPRTLFNTELDSSRSMVLCDLPLKPVKAMAKKAGGSVNDVLLAICGGALRAYLQQQQCLPRSSLIAGMPVSLKSGNDDVGNKLSYIMAPFFTQEADDLKRLQRVIKFAKHVNGKSVLKDISVDEVDCALLSIIRRVQQKAF